MAMIPHVRNIHGPLEFISILPSNRVVGRVDSLWRILAAAATYFRFVCLRRIANGSRGRRVEGDSRRRWSKEIERDEFVVFLLARSRSSGWKE